jgi:hypothetical protein
VPPLDEHSKARFEIRKSRRGMAFVRAGREIETVDAFPRRASDKASNLGDWPLLQGYAYHWAMEVKFEPALDPVFGITHDKQTVRPIEDFWRLLHDEGIDDLLRREQGWQEAQRNKARLARLQVRLERVGDQPSPAELAAQAADVAVGEQPAVPDFARPEANLAFEQRAQEEATKRGQPIDAAREALSDQMKRQRYRVEFVDDEHGPFYTPDWSGNQVMVRINRRHPFYQALYGTLLQIPGGSLAKESVDLLLIALGRGELMTNNPETTEFYRAQRVERWSPYLASAIRTLSRNFPSSEEKDEEAA